MSKTETKIQRVIKVKKHPKCSKCGSQNLAVETIHGQINSIWCLDCNNMDSYDEQTRYAYAVISTNSVSKEKYVLDTFGTRKEAKICKDYYDKFSEIPNQIIKAK